MPPPIPAPFWPQWAKYCTVDADGLTRFWSNKPKQLQGRWGITGGKRAEWGYTDRPGDWSKCIWGR